MFFFSFSFYSKKLDSHNLYYFLLFFLILYSLFFILILFSRATCEYFTKSYHKALASYQKILEIEPDNKDAQAGLNRVVRIIEGNMQSGNVDPEQRARAMADPEIKAILEDPYMQSVLREMQTDPAAFQGYMKQPDVAAKINKLIQSGILQVGSGPRK